MPTALRFLARLLLVAALLGAEQAAVAHELWHAARDVAGFPQPAQGDGNGQSSLCDLHDLLGSVLGAIEGSAAASSPPSETFARPGAAWVPRGSADAVHASSRGPPALS